MRQRIVDKFDYDVTGLATYVDEQGEEILTDLIYSSNLISRVQVMENVKGSKEIKLMDSTFALQSAASCAWNADGSVTFTDKALVTSRVKVQHELCNEDLVDTWGQLLLAVGANRQDEEIPFEDVLTAYTIKKAKKLNQDLMFNGDTASGNPDLAHYDGFIKLWDADASLVEVTSLQTSITAANGYDVAKEVYDGIPAELFDNDVEVEIICSRNSARAVIDQIYNDKDFASTLEFTEENGELSFILPTTSVRVRSYPQIADGKMYAVPYQYMFFGTDLENDVDGFEAKYNENDEKIRFGAKWRTGINYVYSEYFVKLTLAAS